ncbi:MAG: hypothetical protein ACE5LX_00855 [Nitrospinota bacterium]
MRSIRAFFITFLITTTFLFLFSGKTFGQAEKPWWTKISPGAGIEFEFEYWRAETSFSMHGHPPAATNEWELKYDDLGANILTISGRWNFMRGAFLEASYGFGNIEEGDLTDTDWDAAGVVSDYSVSTASGDTRSYDLNLFYRFEFQEIWMLKRSHLDLLVGYRNHKDSVEYEDALTTISNYQSVSIFSPGIWNENELTYDGIRLGLGGEVELSYRFALRASVGYMPDVDADYYELRYPGTASAVRGDITADGHAWDFDIAFSFNPVPNLSFSLGYRYMRFRTTGEDDPISNWAGSHERLETKYEGVFIGMRYAF